MHFQPYSYANGFGAADPDRVRKLLLHRRQIEEIHQRTSQDSVTLIPMSVYFSDGRAKVELAVARGPTPLRQATGHRQTGTPTGRPAGVASEHERAGRIRTMSAPTAPSAPRPAPADVARLSTR